MESMHTVRKSIQVPSNYLLQYRNFEKRLNSQNMRRIAFPKAIEPICFEIDREAFMVRQPLFPTMMLEMQVNDNSLAYKELRDKISSLKRKKSVSCKQRMYRCEGDVYGRVVPYKQNPRFLDYMRDRRQFASRIR